MNLALNLRAVISQRLVIGKDGRRMPATEVLLNTPHIRDMIRRGQIHEIKEAMDRSLEEGMHTLRPVLFMKLYRRPHRPRGVPAKADSRDGLALKIRLGEGARRHADDRRVQPAGALTEASTEPRTKTPPTGGVFVCAARN